MQFESRVDAVVLGQMAREVVRALEYLTARSRSAVVGAWIRAGAVSVRHVTREGSLQLRLVIAKRALECIVGVDAKMVFEVVAVFEGSAAFQALKRE